MSSPTGQIPEFVAMVGNIQSAFAPLLQVVATQYEITSGDVSAGFASIMSTWPTPFIDASYAIVQGISHNSARASNDYSTGDIDSVSATGFNSRIYVNNSTAQAGDIIILWSLGIHK